MKWLKKLYRNKLLRQIVFIAILLAIWQAVVSTGRYSELLLPGLPSIWSALVDSASTGELWEHTQYSFYLIGIALGVGALLAFSFTALSMVSDLFADFVKTITTIFHPLAGCGAAPDCAFVVSASAENLSFSFWFTHSVAINPEYLHWIQIGSRTQLEVGRNLV